jgi:hypothetical protein
MAADTPVPHSGTGEHAAVLFTRAEDDTGQPVIVFQGQVLDAATATRSVLLSEFLDGSVLNQTIEATATSEQVSRWAHHPPSKRAENVPIDALWDVLNVRFFKWLQLSRGLVT